MSLSKNRQYAINHAVIGDQAPVGTILAALQNGVVGHIPNTYADGFTANSVSGDALLAPGSVGSGSLASASVGTTALALASATTTTSATAGTVTTTTYVVPGAPSAFTGAVWTAGNGYLAVTSSTPGYSYTVASGTGTLSIDVASAAASQTLTVYILNA